MGGVCTLGGDPRWPQCLSLEHQAEAGKCRGCRKAGGGPTNSPQTGSLVPSGATAKPQGPATRSRATQGQMCLNMALLDATAASGALPALPACLRGAGRGDPRGGPGFDSKKREEFEPLPKDSSHQQTRQFQGTTCDRVLLLFIPGKKRAQDFTLIISKTSPTFLNVYFL